jgi:hypothetical protein
MSKSLSERAFLAHANSIDHGFWPGIEKGQPHFPTRNFGEQIALIHSEYSEALEEHRSGQPFVYFDESGKPEGIAVEIVDGLIRSFDVLGSMQDNVTLLIPGYDQDGLKADYTVDEVFELKAKFNAAREAKHGRAY